jgi:hypothetical protein
MSAEQLQLFDPRPTKLAIFHALVQAWELARETPVPAPGTYVIGTEMSDGLYGTGQPIEVHNLAEVRASAAGAPMIDVIFRPRYRPAVQRSIRVAFDGSWRDAATLLPVNMYGETFS